MVRVVWKAPAKNVDLSGWETSLLFLSEVKLIVKLLFKTNVRINMKVKIFQKVKMPAKNVDSSGQETTFKKSFKYID